MLETATATVECMGLQWKC